MMIMPIHQTDTNSEIEIRRLRQTWAFSRDAGDFDTMSKCFHPDAEASISWFKGAVRDLTPLLIASDKARKPTEHSKHWLGNCLVHINGDRAVMETDVTIMMREYIHDQLFDYSGYCRFYDQVERRNGRWAISLWTAIFDKDRLDPVQGVAPDWLTDIKLETGTSGFAFMQMRQIKKGRQIPADTVMGNSEAERALRRRYEAWLSQSTPDSRQ